MNKRQNAIIDIGLAIVVLLLLFPPWCVVSRGSHGYIIPHGYHFLFSPPCCSPHIDLARYLVPVGVVCLMVLLACLELNGEHRRGNEPDKSR